jgi:hypothetical protein
MMMRFGVMGLALGGLVLAVAAAVSQPPERREPRDAREPREHAGPPRGGPGHPPPPPPAYEPGRLMPPHVRDELELTPDQAKQLRELEIDVKGRILKLLTEDQKKTLDDFRPRRPPQGGQQRPVRPNDRPERPRPDDQEEDGGD